MSKIFIFVLAAVLVVTTGCGVGGKESPAASAAVAPPVPQPAPLAPAPVVVELRTSSAWLFETGPMVAVLTNLAAGREVSVTLNNVHLGYGLSKVQGLTAGDILRIECAGGASTHTVTLAPVAPDTTTKNSTTAKS